MLGINLLAFSVGFAAATAISLWLLQRWSLSYRNKPLWGRHPIPTVSLIEIDPTFTPDQFGSTPQAEVRLSGGTAIGGTSTQEGWILATLAKQARRMFEFGTCTGKTAYTWAVNSPPEARVTTLTLAPTDQEEYQSDSGDAARDTRTAIRESRFDRFVYNGTEVEHKVEQLFGDSKRFDDDACPETFDLIFVDGSHAYSYVMSDSRKAIRMLAPGGLLLWHDYRGPHRAQGVYRALNSLANELPLAHIEKTSLVCYRKPAA